MGATTLMFTGNTFFGSILFCLSISYKQMSLYFAPAFFFWLIGKTWHSENSFLGFAVQLCKLGIAVIGSFVVCFLPFITFGMNSVFQVWNTVC